MSGESGEQDQAGEQVTQLGKNLQVNEATLELLQRRIEAKVRASLFRGIGLPLGAAGTAALLVGLFVVVPTKVSELLNQPTFQTELQKTVEDSAGNVIDRSVRQYLADPGGGGKLITTQVERAVGAQISQAVATYFSGTDTQRELQRKLQAATDDFFTSDNGKRLVSELVSKQLASDEVRKVIVDSVNTALKPGTAAWTNPIERNRERMVSELSSNTLESMNQLAKAGPPELGKFLGSEEARRLKRDGGQLALVMRIRRGPMFGEFALHDYLDGLRGAFGDRFRFVVFVDGEHGDAYLGAITPEQLLAHLPEVVRLANSPPTEFTPEQMVQQLRQRPGSTLQGVIALDTRAEDALRSGAWPHGRLNAEVAVCNATGQIVGTTTRQRLIEGILSTPSDQ